METLYPKDEKALMDTISSLISGNNFGKVLKSSLMKMK